MVDFQRARAHMVESQLRAGGVTNASILASMRAVPRENFVDPRRRDVAYVDDIQWLGNRAAGRFMPAPATLAKLIDLAEIAPGDRVLDLGAGTGYATAVMANLAGEVTGLEPDAGLAAQAVNNLAALGLNNARIVAGELGQLGSASFDVVIVEGALESVPEAYLARLDDGGRLVALLGTGAALVANLFVKSGGDTTVRADFNAYLPPLVRQRNEDFVF